MEVRPHRREEHDRERVNALPVAHAGEQHEQADEAQVTEDLPASAQILRVDLHVEERERQEREAREQRPGAEPEERGRQPLHGGAGEHQPARACDVRDECEKDSAPAAVDRPAAANGRVRERIDVRQRMMREKPAPRGYGPEAVAENRHVVHDHAREREQARDHERGLGRPLERRATHGDPPPQARESSPARRITSSEAGRASTLLSTRRAASTWPSRQSIDASAR